MPKNESYSVKHEITDAVMQLMAEKNYMDITVTDIVNKAGVARASFYRNFNSINDVIDTIVDEISDELIEDAKMLWGELVNKGLVNHAADILTKTFGKPTKFSEVLPEQVDLLAVALNEIRGLL